ncbi:MAG: hypothetical protein ACI9XO_001673 [Paraglaciecola sp.]|jgi:hypothetical protein
MTVSKVENKDKRNTWELAELFFTVTKSEFKGLGVIFDFKKQ